MYVRVQYIVSCTVTVLYVNLLMSESSWTPLCPSFCRHIFQPLLTCLEHVSSHMEDPGQRYELLLKALKLFVQQGVEAKRASERSEDPSTVKVLVTARNWMLYAIKFLVHLLSTCIKCVKLLDMVVVSEWLYWCGPLLPCRPLQAHLV